MLQKYAIYGEAKIPVLPTESLEDVKAKLVQYYPELRNSQAFLDTATGNITFKTTGGTKGVDRFAIYGEAKIPVLQNESLEAIKAKLVQYYPELRNSQAYLDGANNVQFRTVGGTKGVIA